MGALCKHQTQPQRSHCDLTALPRCPHGVVGDLTGCYGDRTEFPQRSFQNAEGRRLFCACSKQTASLGVLSRSMRSHGDPTALLPHPHSASTISRTPWERHHSVTGVLRGVILQYIGYLQYKKCNFDFQIYSCIQYIQYLQG